VNAEHRSFPGPAAVGTVARLSVQRLQPLRDPGRATLTRTYLGAGRAAEILGCTQGWLWRLRNEDPDFPSHGVEIHEPRAVFLGWTERSMLAYQARRSARQGRLGDARSSHPSPAVLIGVNRVAELLEVTRSRVLQLRVSDPRFPPPKVELLERTRVREGYDETAAAAYARQRNPRPGRPARSARR
jgi:predicted DNA-binding transcriptional regulator AlpA